jgi:hypothetical protein
LDNENRSKKIKLGIERAKAIRGKWGRPGVAELKGDPHLAAKASELRTQGLSWSQIASRLDISRSSARRLVNLYQKDAAGQIDNHLDSTVPNRGVSDTCVEKTDRIEDVQTDLVDTVQSIHVSTNDEVLAKMPKTFRIFSDLLKQVREDQPKNTG